MGVGSGKRNPVEKKEQLNESLWNKRVERGEKGGTLVVKLPRTEVPQWKPHSWTVNAMATDHEGTPESGDSDRNRKATGPVQFDQKYQGSKHPTESFPFRLRCRGNKQLL